MSNQILNPRLQIVILKLLRMCCFLFSDFFLYQHCSQVVNKKKKKRNLLCGGGIEFCVGNSPKQMHH